MTQKCAGVDERQTRTSTRRLGGLLQTHIIVVGRVQGSGVTVRYSGGGTETGRRMGCWMWSMV